MKTLDNLGTLQTFVQVADHLSFAAVARAQGVSASAVGKAIARLERQLGVRLFQRSTRSLALTAEGRLFLARCRRVLGELEAAELELSSRTEAPRGHLKLGFPLASPMVLSVLADFAKTYSEIRLELDFDDRLVDVIEEGFDAVLRVSQPTDSRLASRRIGRFRRLLVASPDYLARKGTPRQPADLARHDCLHYRYPTSGRMETWPTPPDIELPVTLVCNDLHARVMLATQGCGIAWLPDHMVRTQLDDGRLTIVLDEHFRADGFYSLLWPSGRHMLPKLRVFVDFMAERLPPDDAPVAASRA